VPEIDVSVVIPTFRREHELAEAVESVLSQEGVALEVIVVDDSPDGSARMTVQGIVDSRVHYVERSARSDGKPALVRNEGARLASGRYLYFLDDDDHVLSDALQRLAAALDTHPQAGVTFGTVVPFGLNERDLQTDRAWSAHARRAAFRTASSRLLTTGALLFKASMLVNSACMIRRDCFDALGGYDPSLPTYEDVDFYLRAIRKFGHVFIDYPVLHRRVGAPSLTHDLGDDVEPIAAAYQQMFRRYKEAHGSLEFTALRIVARFLPLLAG
jgi:GT2 family glycosyltransferase